MIGWGFSGFLQGIAGFGAPVASAVPLLRIAGFSAIPSIAAAMVGHSWAITFGSMGSSYYAILLVTRLSADAATPWIAALFVLPILLTGLAALHILLGWNGVRDGALVVLAVGIAMALGMWTMAELGAAPIASVIPGLLGCGLLWLIGRREPALVHVRSGAMGFGLAFLPYLLLIALTLLTQFGPLATASRNLVVGIDLPGTGTALGYQALPEATFPRLRILQHPATLIALAIVGMMLVYRRTGWWPNHALRQAVHATYQGSKASSVAVTFMVLMALVMADSGMTSALAHGIQTVAGPAFPLISPLLGVLGALLTGSNTSSNITMGALQVETAAALGTAPALIAAAQTVGGALGAGVSPDKAAIGASVGGVMGQEATIMRRALPYSVAVALVVGIEVLILAHV
jgi:lactate permease